MPRITGTYATASVGVEGDLVFVRGRDPGRDE